MWDILGTIASSILGGGVTGLLGVAVQRIADYKNKQLDLQLSQQKFSHDLALREVDAKILQQEWASRTKVAEVESAGRSDVAESQAFAASFNEPVRYAEGVHTTKGQGWLLVVLDFVRGIVRPGLTVYLCVITTMIYMQAYRLLGYSVDPKDAMELVKLVVGTFLYLCTTCVLWWFGTRNHQKAPKVKL